MALEYEKRGLKDRQFVAPFSPVQAGLINRVVKICQNIPTDVHLALHLCYGDLGHRHFLEPDDTSLLVNFANARFKALKSTYTIEWLHLPVPQSRDDAAYFEPPNELKPDTTRLYLGLVHAHDEEGTKKRVETALSVCQYPFGVATECGLGRTPKEDFDSILSISREVSIGVDGNT